MLLETTSFPGTQESLSANSYIAIEPIKVISPKQRASDLELQRSRYGATLTTSTARVGCHRESTLVDENIT